MAKCQYTGMCKCYTSLSRLYEKPEDGQNRPKYVVSIHCTHSTINLVVFRLPIVHYTY